MWKIINVYVTEHPPPSPSNYGFADPALRTTALKKNHRP